MIDPSKPEGTTTTQQTTTTQTDIPPAGDSSLFGISVRACVCLLFTLSVCLIQVAGAIITGHFTVEEPLYGLTYLAVGFFFGQAVKKVLP
jgi:hypothetical protein